MMLWKLYILLGLGFSGVVFFVGYATYETFIWEFAYFIASKSGMILAFIVMIDLVEGRRKLNFEERIKAIKALQSGVGLFLIRLLWEIMAIIMGYGFMLQKSVNITYLIIVLCYLGLVIYWINKSSFWKQKARG